MVITSPRHVVLEAEDQESTVARTTILDHVGKAAFAEYVGFAPGGIAANRGSAYSDDVKHFFLTVRR
jgi:hypothetical protein